MITDPGRIENMSFEIITRELKRPLDEASAPMITRMIHTTADFEYADITVISPGAIESGMEAVAGGCRIYTDTKMARAGVSREGLAKWGASVYTCVSDDDVVREARERGITRSIAGIEKAARDPGTRIFAIGNAPTALFTLRDLIRKGALKPDLVIGVPVGFVGAAESKEAFMDTGVPYIITRGRKGGSTIAVAILNALMIMMES